jgi:flagellar basal-body rod protein FlgB
MLEHVAGNIEAYMTLLSERQKVVVSNIANADTPGYKTQDVDFQTAFDSALGPTQGRVVETPGLPVKNDGNNVDLDREARLLSENAMRFSIASTLARSELSSIRSAIQDGQSS